jgi:hypothetical protein
MTPSQSTAHDNTRPEPSRWPRDQRGRARDHFADPDPFSQREYARRHGIPRSTLGDWLRPDDPDGLDPELVAFLRSATGERFQRRLVLALLLIFHLDNACGLRQLTRWLAFTQLDRFVASSYGALYDLAARLQADLGRFGDEERQRLGSAMLAQRITLCCDEHFHGALPCLVAIEPVSNFLVVEGYHERRDGQTWKEAIDAGLRGLPVQVIQITSDQAKGLLRCARDGFTAAHSPDVFHLQRDVSRPHLLPLARPVQQAQKDRDKAKEQSQRLEALHQTERQEGRKGTAAALERIIESVRDELCAEQRLREGQQLQEQAHQEVRGLADDYHPFDAQTGRPVTAAEVEQRLRQRLGNLEGVADKADLAQRATEGVAKAYGWVGLWSACVAWFWLLTRQRVAALDLCDVAERLVSDSQARARQGRAAAVEGVSRTVTAGSVVARRCAGVFAAGGAGDGGAGGASVCGSVPAFYLVCGGPERSAVAAAARSWSCERGPPQGVDDAAQLPGETPRREYGCGAVLRSTASGRVQLVAGTAARPTPTGCKKAAQGGETS